MIIVTIIGWTLAGFFLGAMIGAYSTLPPDNETEYDGEDIRT